MAFALALMLLPFSILGRIVVVETRSHARRFLSMFPFSILGRIVVVETLRLLTRSDGKLIYFQYPRTDRGG